MTSSYILPPKTRYDDPIPEGKPNQQWHWALSEWNKYTGGFDALHASLCESLDRIAAKVSEMSQLGEPPLVTQIEIFAELDQVCLNRAGLQFRYLDSDEAHADLVTLQEQHAPALAHNSAERLAARQQRQESRNQHLASIEERRNSFYERLKKDAQATVDACPAWSTHTGKFAQLGFFLRDHCGGPQPEGWVTVSE